MRIFWGLAGLCAVTLAHANPALLDNYAREARAADPAFAGFSAERGRALYFRESSASGKPMQCASCHTANPRQPGKTPAFRQIEPLAPVANPMRFTDAKKVEKWFRRNCDDVFRRECSAQEKGDFVRWLSSLP
jgi:mono/diheme cytochrome c family protein